MIRCCPACESSRLRLRSGRGLTPRQGEGRWLCEACSATFDEPAERPPEGNGQPSRASPAVRALLEADPDAITDDRGGRS